MSLKNLQLEDREQLLLMANIAEKSSQYEDMVEILRPYFEGKEDDLSAEERNLLSVAYKNAIGVKRFSWRAVSQVNSISKYKKFRPDVE